MLLWCTATWCSTRKHTLHIPHWWMYLSLHHMGAARLSDQYSCCVTSQNLEHGFSIIRHYGWDRWDQPTDLQWPLDLYMYMYFTNELPILISKTGSYLLLTYIMYTWATCMCSSRAISNSSQQLFVYKIKSIKFDSQSKIVLYWKPKMY